MVRTVREDTLSRFAPDAPDDPEPRRPDVIAETTDKLWRALLRGLAGEDDAPPQQ